jgi:hypothetical protein
MMVDQVERPLRLSNATCARYGSRNDTLTNVRETIVSSLQVHRGAPLSRIEAETPRQHMVGRWDSEWEPWVGYDVLSRIG